MIDKELTRLAEVMFEAAMRTRTSLPKDDPLSPMLILWKPQNVPPQATKLVLKSAGKPDQAENTLRGDVVFIPANDIVADESGVMLTAVRMRIAQCAPRGVLFWSESWVVDGPPSDVQPRNDPRRRDAIMMMIQTPDDAVIWTCPFDWQGSTPKFAERKAATGIRQFGRLGNWYPMKAATVH